MLVQYQLKYLTLVQGIEGYQEYFSKSLDVYIIMKFK